MLSLRHFLSNAYEYCLLKKLSLVDKNLDDYSLETVKMFADDAIGAGFKL